MAYQVHYKVPYDGTSIWCFEDLESALAFIRPRYWGRGLVSLYELREIQV